MSSITYKTGDLLQADEFAIAHGCNAQGLMGAGVARLVRGTYPEVYEEYSRACRSGAFRLGTAQAVWTDPMVHGQDRLVYNLCTQTLPGAHATPWGIFLSFGNMVEDANVRGIDTVAIPRIGAGIGGLDWELQVAPNIEAAIANSTHDLSVIVYDLETS